MTLGLTFSLMKCTEPSAMAKLAPCCERGPPKPLGERLIPLAGSRTFIGRPQGGKFELISPNMMVLELPSVMSLNLSD